MSHQIIEITNRGIRNALKKYTPERAISEYVWNGFDAEARNVWIDFSYGGLGAVESISIRDDGTGICYENLSFFFRDLEIPIKVRKERIEVCEGKRDMGDLLSLSLQILQNGLQFTEKIKR